MPIRIQRKRVRGWKMPSRSKYVGRGSRFGNPFRININRTREQCIAAYRHWLVTRYPIDGPGMPPSQEDIASLRGLHLSCWCPLDQPCHADVLLELANQESPRG